MRKKSKQPSAVVDTNLFVSGSILKRGDPHQLLLAWRSGAFTLVTSDEQREELHDVLHRSEIAERYSLSGAEISALLRRIDRIAVRTALRGSLPVKVRDPQDEKILATALGGKADYLVTGDADLLELAGHPKLGSLNIVTVKAFLETLQR